MGLWASIKKTLNSTVGTADMVPLDKIFLNQKNLVASDNEYLLLETKGDSSTYPNETTTEMQKKVKMTNAGSVRIKVSLLRINSSSRTYLRVYVNGNEVTNLNSGLTNNYIEETADITFNAGDIISFSVTSRYFQNLRFCATITDSSLYSIEEG